MSISNTVPQSDAALPIALEQQPSNGPKGQASTLAPDSPESADYTSIARRLADHCAAFKGADAKRSILQLIITAVPFVVLLIAMFAAVRGAYWLTLLLAVPTAGLLVRLFIIQHDCGHGSFFNSRAANDWLGRVLSVLTLTPYGHWKQHHALHHATSGNLDRRGFGDIHTVTVREYEAMSAFQRLKYRLYRNPIVMILFGAPISFSVLQRFPVGPRLPVRGAWRSVMSLNVALVVVFGLLTAVFGWEVLLAYLPVSLIGSWIGGWLFFIQHQFEDTEWDRAKDWDRHRAALRSSTYLDLPPILRWFTGNIGLHHIHHLCSRIPNYRLQECLDASPELKRLARRLTLLQSLQCARLALWDEKLRKLVGFRDRTSQATA